MAGLLKVKTAADRRFIPVDFQAESPEQVLPWYEKLLNASPDSPDTLVAWLEQWSELDAALDEDLAWRYIRMTCNTTDPALSARYEQFVGEIYPAIAPLEDQLNRKLLASPFLNDLQGEGYKVMLRGIRAAVALYREENIPLQAALKKLESQYGQIAGAMAIEHDGQELTMQQAAQLLKSDDRNLRELVFNKIQERRKKDEDQLDDLLSEMIRLRHQVAVNAGFANYRDYMFVALGRYDYTPEDCFRFHESVEKHIMPLVRAQSEERRSLMGLESLRPWDLKPEPDGLPPLRPFETADELLSKTIQAFDNLDPYFGDCLRTMEHLGHFDLSSRKGKAPGGYNYPLLETGAPFIFMNATADFRDLETMVHEGGHAIHSFLSQPLRLKAFKATPMEIAEVASMAMELLSMEQWHLFFPNEDDLARARKKQLKGTLSILPWIAVVDAFQHWLYTNPIHSVKERRAIWKQLFHRFTPETDGWNAVPEYLNLQWQAQLHIFEVPFYYIEYGIAQLGSLALYREYLRDRTQGLEGYKKALSLGYTRPLPELYQAAGIRFDFSADYIAELVEEVFPTA